MMVVATWKEKQRDLLLYAFFSPIYWILMSIGAWKGTLQLIFKPYKWEKTSHGTEIVHEQLLIEHPERFSKPIKWIEVKSPEVDRGARKATGTQIAFSVGLTVLLILFALVLFGVLEYKPVTDHFTITKIPGLNQVMKPLKDYQSGRDVRLLNYEAIPGPYSTSPPVILPKPTLTQEITAGPTFQPDRPASKISAPGEPGLIVRYDPLVNRIIITAEKSLPEGDYYVVTIGSGEREYSKNIDTTPGTLSLNGGSGVTQVKVFRVLRTGAQIPVIDSSL